MNKRMKKFLMTGSAMTLVALLAACGSESTAEKSSTGEDSGATEETLVGGMEDYNAGDQFTATEPLTFSMMAPSVLKPRLQYWYPVPGSYLFHAFSHVGDFSRWR